MKPKEIGELSEIVVMAALVKAGLQVLRPYGDSARYDFVFVVYCPQNEQIYVVPITETKRCEVTLVIKSGNNNQHEPKQASDYTLERWLSKLAL